MKILEFKNNRFSDVVKKSKPKTTRYGCIFWTIIAFMVVVWTQQ